MRDPQTPIFNKLVSEYGSKEINDLAAVFGWMTGTPARVFKA